MNTELARPARRNAANTRARILLAARQVFATRDYIQARISDIAAVAEVNQALVIRYFGSKEQLFETALAAVLDDLPPHSSHPWDGFAERIVDHLCADSQSVPDPLPMVIRATSDPVAQAISQRMMQSRVAAPLAAWLGGPKGEVQAATILSLCAGFFTYRHLLPLEPFSGDIAPDARRWLTDAIQAVLDASERGQASELSRV